MAPVGNGMQFNRAQSFAPPKKVADVPMFKRAQSFTAALDITMSVDSLYNHAMRYLKKENNEELAEAAFKAALSRDPCKALLALDRPPGQSLCTFSRAKAKKKIQIQEEKSGQGRGCDR